VYFKGANKIKFLLALGGQKREIFKKVKISLHDAHEQAGEMQT